MYKILLATKNSDKLKYFKRRLKLNFPYSVLSLNEAGIDVEVVEQGTALERAEQKARAAFALLNNNEFDCVVGQDDVIVINGKITADVKTLIPDLLAGKLLNDGDIAYFHQAFYIMDSKGDEIAKLTLVEPCLYKKYKGEINDYSGYVLDKVFTLLEEEELENKPVLLEGYYFENGFIQELSRILSEGKV